MSDISEFRGGGDVYDDEKRDVPMNNITREDVASVVRPFSRWIDSLSGKDNPNQKKMTAFANEHTVKYKYYNHGQGRGDGDVSDGDGDGKKVLSKSERKLKRLQELEYWDSPVFHDDDDVDDDDLDVWEDTAISNAMVQTGYDEKNNLRCGVCGARMKLTKKDRKRGWNEYDKLNRHMKDLHDREQHKRKEQLKHMKPSKKRKLMKRPDSKLMKQMRKYEASQVGLDRNPKGRNDLFPILKEEKVHCIQCHDVDATLIKHATKWMKGRKKKTDDALIYNEKVFVTVVVSEDSDFKDLLRQSNSSSSGRRIAVSVTWNSSEQTRSLVNVSDIVISRREQDDAAIYGDDEDDGDDSTGEEDERDPNDKGGRQQNQPPPPPRRRPSLFVATAVTQRGRSLLEEYPFGS
eukprot:CAMPEP_0113473722 /NCGR_PEP_ID=MMETSP0014_2-20120614/18199_1 /TAXON_ID=2857 /ORGANISM="Nitzschia sp." /LENGTH=404 /DNA_ID=CAMNT_0000366515 /DNA_START=376 /DNA_END=1590 /DNA_ORIENTATION=+ /assembly_acc=CAM_ASM_000159